MLIPVVYIPAAKTAAANPIPDATATSNPSRTG